ANPVAFALIPYRPGRTFAMKPPFRSVVVCLTTFAPSRTNVTSAPARGFPCVSRTVPVMVASDLLEPAPSAPLETNDTSAITDKPRPKAFLMRRPPRLKSRWKPRQANWFRRGDFTWNHQTGPHFRPRRKALSSKHLLNSAKNADILPPFT